MRTLTHRAVWIFAVLNVAKTCAIAEVTGALCKGKRPDHYVWINPLTGRPYTDIKRSFCGTCADAKIEGLVWHDLRATYGTRLGEAGYNAYDIANSWATQIFQQASAMCEICRLGLAKRCC
jgi:hypothetical protein